MAVPKNRTNYRSGLEHLVAVVLQQAKIKASFEKEKLSYKVPSITKKYIVDFTLDKNKDIILEVKGRFTSSDRKKMLYIKEQYPSRQIIMLFGRSSNKLNKKSPTTYSDWCNKNGIAWVDLEKFKENPSCLFTLTRKMDGSLRSQPKTKKLP